MSITTTLSAILRLKRIGGQFYNKLFPNEINKDENLLLSDEEWVAATEHTLKGTPIRDLAKTQSNDKQIYYGVWETHARNCRE